jgi:pimeloyl-ACP methyl ester carboxylesterase
MSWLLYTFLIIFILLLLIALLIWIMGVKSQAPPKNKELTAIPAVPYENIVFLSKGLSIRGWFIPSIQTASPPPLIIIVHGWGSNRSRVLRYAEPLHKAGYALLLFDARGHGESDPYPTPSGIMFRDDVLSAIDYASSRTDIDAERIAIFAYSLGAFGSILAMEHEPRIKVMVTDSMPVRMETMITSELKRHKLPIFPLAFFIPKIWYFRIGISAQEAKRLDIVQIINRTQTPMLLIHSRRDDYISSAELDYVLTNVKPDRVEHLFVHTQGHRSSETDPEFWGKALPFLSKHLLGP